MRRRLVPLLAGLVLLAAPAAAHGYTFYEWDDGGNPTGLVEFNGELHYLVPGAFGIAHMTLGGVMSGDLILGVGVTDPAKLAAGPGGSLWFIGSNAAIGRSAPLVSYPLSGLGTPRDLAATDDTTWVLETDGFMECVDADGHVATHSSFLATRDPIALTRAPDGSLWAVASDGKLVRYTIGAGCGAPLPSLFDLPPGTTPIDIAAAPDGDLYVIATMGEILRVTPNGSDPPTVTPFSLGFTRPDAVSANEEGAWWVD
jgi:streptogramin lyase